MKTLKDVINDGCENCPIKEEGLCRCGEFDVSSQDVNTDMACEEFEEDEDFEEVCSYLLGRKEDDIERQIEKQKAIEAKLKKIEEAKESRKQKLSRRKQLVGSLDRAKRQLNKRLRECKSDYSRIKDYVTNPNKEGILYFDTIFIEQDLENSKNKIAEIEELIAQYQAKIDTTLEQHGYFKK